MWAFANFSRGITRVYMCVCDSRRDEMQIARAIYSIDQTILWIISLSWSRPWELINNEISPTLLVNFTVFYSRTGSDIRGVSGGVCLDRSHSNLQFFRLLCICYFALNIDKRETLIIGRRGSWEIPWLRMCPCDGGIQGMFWGCILNSSLHFKSAYC